MPNTKKLWTDAGPQVHRAEHLRAAVTDSLYRFQPGLRCTQHSVETLGALRILTRHMRHHWGISAQCWARDDDGCIQASAEASVTGHTSGPIVSRIRHLRTGTLLWTHTGAPVSRQPLTAQAHTFTAAAADTCYRLTQSFTLGRTFSPVWTLTVDDADTPAQRFAGLHSVANYALNVLAAGIPTG
jgi:hypothetical protein